MSGTATKVRVWVHREASGYLLSVSTDRTDARDVEDGDTLTEQYVWIEDR